MDDNQKNKIEWYNKYWFTRNLCWLIIAIVSCYLDIKNFLLFRKTIKNLSQDKNSDFNRLGLKCNWLGNIVYTQKDMGRDRLIGFDDRLKNNYLVEHTRVEHDYLHLTLNWGEYLVTKFIEFSDEDGNLSSNYGVIFEFRPISLGNPRIFWFSLFYLIVFGLPLWMTRHQIMYGLEYLWNMIIN